MFRFRETVWKKQIVEGLTQKLEGTGLHVNVMRAIFSGDGLILISDVLTYYARDANIMTKMIASFLRFLWGNDLKVPTGQ